MLDLEISQIIIDGCKLVPILAATYPTISCTLCYFTFVIAYNHSYLVFKPWTMHLLEMYKFWAYLDEVWKKKTKV